MPQRKLQEYIKTKYTPQIKDVQNRRKSTARLTTQMIKLPHAGKFPACPLAFQIAYPLRPW